ncbi:MAG: 8-oxoguanine deaminase [Cyanobacteria bacterium RYN_339]|nr:8-oxoguanine deaminase [Cyanobacteria bacterium RYN_339]
MASTLFRRLGIATLDAAGTVHTQANLLVEGNRIAYIGQEERPADRVVDGDGCLAIPGLINTHHHLYQTLTRVMPEVQSAELFPWLVAQYPVWARMGGEAVKVSSQISLAEMLLSGCTTASDMFYVFPRGSDVSLEHVIEAAAELGIRLHAGRGSMSLGQCAGGLPPDSVVQTQEEILADTELMIDRHHQAEPGGMVRIDVMPCSPFSVTRELMEASRDLARRRGVLLHTHLAETLDEERFCIERFGMRPLAYLEAMGWLGEDVYVAHGIHFNDEELDLLARTKTGVAHCPSSNMRLGSGICRVVEMRQRGVRVGLAVDGSASNDGNNLLLEARQALLLARLRTGASSMTPLDALRLATNGSADVLHRPELGSLEVGKVADIAIFDLNRIEYAGAVEQDPVGALLLCHPTPPRYVMINGEIRVEHGAIKGLDLERLLKRHNELVRALRGQPERV